MILLSSYTCIHLSVRLHSTASYDRIRRGSLPEYTQLHIPAKSGKVSRNFFFWKNEKSCSYLSKYKLLYKHGASSCPLWLSVIFGYSVVANAEIEYSNYIPQWIPIYFLLILCGWAMKNGMGAHSNKQANKRHESIFIESSSFLYKLRIDAIQHQNK